MKTREREFKFFTIPQWEKEQDYLGQQHKNGWKFAKVSFLGLYHFERCEPEDVVYQLDYNPDGLAHKNEYVQLFRDCGWEYLQDYAGYSYFRKSAAQMNGDEQIFCDDSSRLDMMKRVLKGRMLPLLIFFFLVILPNLYLQSHSDAPLSSILLAGFIALFVLYLVLFLQFGYQFWKYWNTLRK